MELEYNNARGRLNFLENDPDYIAATEKLDSVWDQWLNKGTISDEAADAMAKEIARQHPAYSEAQEIMNSLRQLSPRVTNSFDPANSYEIGLNAYQRLAGEAEARAVQDRMNMSMDQRRALFPEYAGRNDLIVRGLMSGGK